MKTSTLLMMLFAVCLIPVSARGADIDGKWKSYGKSLTSLGDIYFTFKADGKTLSGTISSPIRNSTISKGKISGDKFQFVVEVTEPLVDTKYTFKGVIEGDEIKLTYQMELGPPKHGNYPLVPPVGGYVNNSPFPNNPNVHSGSSSTNANIGIPSTKELLLKKVKE
jgi:hypothetical protein